MAPPVLWRCLLILASAPAALAVKAKAAPARAAESKKAPAAASALQRDQSSPEMAKATAAPLLLSLLKELKGEAEATMKYTTSISKWCKDTKAQKAAMSTVLQRQLDEARIAVQQVESEEVRLGAEAHLANGTAGQKQKQLASAASTASFASSEFGSEQRQIEKTIDAASRAIRFIEMQQAQQGKDVQIESSVVASFLQVKDSAMSEDEQKLLDMVASSGGDEDSSSTQTLTASDELVQMLTQLRTRLEQERVAEVTEHGAMLHKLESFADHLNSSIIETESQVAAIRMEAAQRKRAKAGWDGKISDLTNMLNAVKSSAKAVESACKEDAKHRRELAQHIQTELTAATSLLKKMPSSSSYLLFGDPDSEASLASEAAPSLIQVSMEESTRVLKRAMEDLKTMAKKFPEESDLYADTERMLSSAPVIDFRLTPGHGDVGDSSKALENIAQFVKDDSIKEDNAATHLAVEAAQGEQQSRVSDQVKGVYSGLVGKIRAKEHAVSDERGHCMSILHDADADTTSLERSMKRVSAKLHIAQVAVSEHEQTSAFQDQQHVLIQQQLNSLAQIAQQSEREGQQFLEALRSHAEQLISLTTDLEPAEQEGDEHHIALLVRNLAQMIERHQATLQQQQRRFGDEKKTVDNADQVLLRLLSANAEHSRRRLSGVKAEAELLQSLAKAKADDLRLSQEYQLIARQLCSKDKVDKLGAKAQQLHGELATLQQVASGEAPTVVA